MGPNRFEENLIYSDQKEFVEGRNISESNRMIDDIINYVDEEDQDGIIVFVDKEKAYDRVEWSWVNHVLKGFNFRSKFCGWIQMLFKYAKICIKANSFTSTLFSLAWSTRHVCSVAPELYILQVEPMACAIRGTYEIKRIQMPGSEHALDIENQL